MIEDADGRPVILLNPRLKDRPSSGNVMQVNRVLESAKICVVHGCLQAMGRQARLDFVSTFKEVYSCRQLRSGASTYVIRGILLKEGVRSEIKLV
jgi:hypothetical protein